MKLKILSDHLKEIDEFLLSGSAYNFNGLLQEKKYQNYALAKKFYSKGISDMAAYGYYGNDYASYAYFGLSRISEMKTTNPAGKPTGKRQSK